MKVIMYNEYHMAVNSSVSDFCIVTIYLFYLYMHGLIIILDNYGFMGHDKYNIYIYIIYI